MNRNIILMWVSHP